MKIFKDVLEENSVLFRFELWDHSKTSKLVVLSVFSMCCLLGLLLSAVV